MVIMSCDGCKNSCCISKKPALSRADILRINKKVNNIEDAVVFNPYIEGRKVKGLRDFEGVLTLRNKGMACIFYKDEKCSIYNSRPTSCRLYPYNPIFREHGKGKYSFDITVDKQCKANNDLKFNKAIALQWRKERKEYDILAFEWNRGKERRLTKFVEALINGKHNSN